jgi:RNA polymerase sigma factor (sigma-70 family)
VANTGPGTLMGRLQQLILPPNGALLTDGQLLKRYCSRQDGAAFEALVRRHGPMVFSVCRRVCRQQQDAEDAFQASFLVLARKAKSIRPAEAVGNWLHGVAYRTALRARATAARRVAREKQVKNVPHPTIENTAAENELEALLDQELSRLANKYRLPLVLCELEGRSRKDVARQLKLPEGTLSSRLATGRRLLAARLTRRGITLTSGVVGFTLTSKHAAACLPPQLLARTAKAGCLLAAGQNVTESLVSTQATSLMEGILKTMLLSKLKLGVAVLAVVSLVCAGGYSLSAAPAQANAEVPVKPRRPALTHAPTRAKQDTAAKGTPETPIAKPARLRGRFTDAETGKPVAGASLRILILGLPRTQRTVEAISDAEGRYELSLPYGHASFWGVMGPPGYYCREERSKTYGAICMSQAEPQIVRDFELQGGSPWKVEVVGVGANKEDSFLFTIQPSQPFRNERLPVPAGSILQVPARGGSNGKLVATFPYTNEVRTLRGGWIGKFPNEIPEATVQFEGEFDAEHIKGDPELLNDGKAIGLRDVRNRSAIVKGAEVAISGGQAILKLRARPIVDSIPLELRGRVVDESGKPVEGAKLSVALGTDQGGGMTLIETKTNARGVFSLQPVSLAPGYFEPDHWITTVVTKSGHNGVQTKKHSLADAKDARLVDFGQLVLKSGHKLKGRVVDEKGQGVQGAVITNMTDYFLYGDLQCRTDAEGRFTMPDLGVGLQNISAQYGEAFGERNFQLDPNSGECLITVKKPEPRPAR